MCCFIPLRVVGSQDVPLIQNRSSASPAPRPSHHHRAHPRPPSRRLPRVENYPEGISGCAELGNAVLCLDDTTEENGCLYYVPTKPEDLKLRPHKDGVVGFSRALADWSEDDAARERPIQT